METAYNEKVDNNCVDILGSSASGFSDKQSPKVNMKLFFFLKYIEVLYLNVISRSC